jgi:hypothetical protein
MYGMLSPCAGRSEVDNGKLIESKLATLDSLIVALLYHDRELKRTEKVKFTLDRCGVGHVSYRSSQQSSNSKHCYHRKRSGHIENDCWQKRPKRLPKSADRRKKHNRKDDDNSASPYRRETRQQPEKSGDKELKLSSYKQPTPDQTDPTEW